MQVPETGLVEHQQDLLGEAEVLLEAAGLLEDDPSLVPKAGPDLDSPALGERIELEGSG